LACHFHWINYFCVVGNKKDVSFSRQGRLFALAHTVAGANFAKKKFSYGHNLKTLYPCAPAAPLGDAVAIRTVGWPCPQRPTPCDGYILTEV
jgi:hypothetical protein